MLNAMRAHTVLKRQTLTGCVLRGNARRYIPEKDRRSERTEPSYCYTQPSSSSRSGGATKLFISGPSDAFSLCVLEHHWPWTTRLLYHISFQLMFLFWIGKRHIRSDGSKFTHSGKEKQKLDSRFPILRLWLELACMIYGAVFRPRK